MEYLVASSVWWDGRMRTGEALRRDGVITPVPLADVPAGAPRRDFPGTLMPGLVDAHVHSTLIDPATVRAGGIAAVWDLGGALDQVAALAARPFPGLPVMRFAGPFLIAPGGYPSDRAWAPPGSWRELHSAADAAEAVAAAQAAGATLIKTTAPLPAPATTTAVVSAAHAAGLEVVVHADDSRGVAAALDADADLLAHTPWTDRLDAGLVRACAARQRWISTLDIHGWGEPTPSLVTAVANLRLFLRYGGSVRYGTDLGNGPLPPAVNPREIRALQSAGLSPAAVLTAMTENDLDEISWIPGGLDLDPPHFADSLATTRVLDPGVRPR
jgi:imidazolonepropionase-like amidohydrolase